MKNYFKAYIIRCPKCKELGREKHRDFLFTPYFSCNWCDYSDINDVAYKENEAEKEVENKVKEMVRYLLPSDNPLVLIVDTANAAVLSEIPSNYFVCAGATDWRTKTINIPRKALYLPRKEVADTSAHESGHIPTGEKEEKKGYIDRGHGDYWRPVYLDFRSQVFNQFSDWINAPPDLEPRFTKGYRNKGGIYPSRKKKRGKYKSYWEAEYSLEADEDMKFTGDYFDPYED